MSSPNENNVDASSEQRLPLLALAWLMARIPFAICNKSYNDSIYSVMIVFTA